MRSIKSLTLPRWLKLGRPKKFSIDVEDWIFWIMIKQNPNGIMFASQSGVPGRNVRRHFLCHVRTPNGKTKWVRGKIAKERYNRIWKKGRWQGIQNSKRDLRVLARDDNGRRLLLDDSVWKKNVKRESALKFRNIVELSLALEEFLLADF